MGQAARWFMCAAACLLIAGGAVADDSYAIFGTVTTKSGAALAGVTVDFGDKLASVVTDDAGYYESPGAIEGAVYLLEPAAAGWTFAPARRAVVMGSGDEQVNFVAEPVGGPFAGMLFAPPTTASARIKMVPLVNYPTGGETWKQGGAYNIRWSYPDSSCTRIWLRLLKNGAVHTTITTNTANDGSFWWKVPASVEPGTDYSMQVADTTKIGTGGDFTIEAAPLVTYPSDAGICWRRGQGYQIKWQGFPGANVRIQLYRGSSLIRSIAWSTPNDGSFWWSVPTDLPTADNYKIKVSQQNKAVVTDMSDKPFSIVNNPRVTYPTYLGVVWDIGGSYSITWTQFVANQVKIDLIRGTTLDRTVAAATANDGSFHWQVPYDMPVGANFKIRVRAVGCAAQSDKSNQPFEIRRVPAVTHPTTDGIVWDAGSPYTIKWHGFASANVKIELLKGWALDRVITGWTPNDGEFKWWVPAGQTPGTNYRIRISGRPNNGQQDVSDRNFTIALVPMVMNPTASGIEWDHGDHVEITWQGFDAASVNIELWRWGVRNKIISCSTPNDGSFWWDVSPASGASGGGFRIRIVECPGLTVYDESNNQFRINCNPTVLSPNGGETVTGSCSVSWRGFSGSQVRVVLLHGDAPVADSWPIDNDGFDNMAIGMFASDDNYRVRITSVSVPSEVDFSDDYFTIDNG